MSSRERVGPLYNSDEDITWYGFNYTDTVIVSGYDYLRQADFILTLSNVNHVIEDTIPAEEVNRLTTFYNEDRSDNYGTGTAVSSYTHKYIIEVNSRFGSTTGNDKPNYVTIYENYGMYEKDGIKHWFAGSEPSIPQAGFAWGQATFVNVWLRQANGDWKFDYVGRPNWNETVWTAEYGTIFRYEYDINWNGGIPVIYNPRTYLEEYDYPGTVTDDIIEYLFSWDLNPKGGTPEMAWTKPDSWADLGYVNIYNPSKSKVQTIGGWVFDRTCHLFTSASDLVQAIIALKMYPLNGAISNLEGHDEPFKASRSYSTNVSTSTLNKDFLVRQLDEQYVEVNMGNVTVSRIFNDYRDFGPYTRMNVFVPFIGYINFDASSLMGNTINLRYRIDIATGAFVAYMTIYDATGEEIYVNQQAGMMGTDIPVNSSSFDNVVRGIMQIAGGVAMATATVATAGAATPATAGLGIAGSATVRGITTATTPSDIIGGTSQGSPALLGDLQPHILIEFPENIDISDYATYYGQPANKSDTLGAFNGFVAISEVHLDNVQCTQAEKTEIETLLKAGVII